MAIGVGFEPTGHLTIAHLFSRQRRYNHFGTLPLFIGTIILYLPMTSILVGDKGLEPIVTFRFLLVRQAL